MISIMMDPSKQVQRFSVKKKKHTLMASYYYKLIYSDNIIYFNNMWEGSLSDVDIG